MQQALANLLAASLVLLAPLPVLGDLGAALRRAAAQASTPLPASAPLNSTVVVPLQRVGVRKTGAHSVLDASFYIGNIWVGHPSQELSVMFDTSSGHVLLPHRACKRVACLEHRRYSPWASSTAMDVNVDGGLVQAGRRFAKGRGVRDGATIGYTQSDLGEGEAKSVVVRDSLCVGQAEKACVDMALLAATSLDETPFRAMPNDGIIGLGLQSLAAGPLLSFAARLFEGSRNVLPQFGISLGQESGEIHFGGHELARFEGPLTWFPVHRPEDGYWQVAIKAIRVGGVTVDNCRRGCHAVVDTGVSRLGVQASRLPGLKAALTSTASDEGRCMGPDLTFDLGSMAVTLGPQDYASGDCTAQLGSLSLDDGPKFTGVYAFGGTVLRRYYAAFDWEQRKVGFAPLGASGRDSSLVPATASQAPATLVVF